MNFNNCNLPPTSFTGCGNQYPIVPGTNPAIQTWNGNKFVVADGSSKNQISLPFLQINTGTPSHVVGSDSKGVWSYYPYAVPTSVQNVAGGQSGNLVYQVAPSVTGFVSDGGVNQVLLSSGSGSPFWVNQSSLIAGSSATATTANYATNLTNSIVGSVPYTSGSNVTSFLSPSPTAGYVLSSQGANQPPAWIQNTAVTTSANTVLGGTNGQILQSTGGSSSTWVSGTYVTSGSLGLNPNTSGQDCSTALQAAVFAAAQTTHQRLLITAGTYYFTKTITIPAQVKIVGEVAGDVGGYAPWTTGASPATAATFIGSISGNTLTVSSISYGSVFLGMTVNGTGISTGTIVTSFNSGTGQTGTYTLNNSQTISSESMTGTFGVFPFATRFAFTGTPVTGTTISASSGSNTLTVSSTTGLAVGMTITAVGVNQGAFIYNINTSANTISISSTTNAVISAGTSAVFAPSAFYIPLSASNELKSFELYSTNTSLTIGQAGAGLLISNGDPTGSTSFESYPYFTGNEGLIESVFIHDFNINLLSNFDGGGTKIYSSNFSFARLVNVQIGCGTYTNSSEGGGSFDFNTCFIGGIQLLSTTPQQYQGDGITAYGGIISFRNSWIYAIPHAANLIYTNIYLENVYTESNYSTDYFFKCWGACEITANNCHFAIPQAFVDSGLPVWDLTGGTGNTSLVLNNCSGNTGPIYSLGGSGWVTSIPLNNYTGQYQNFSPPLKITGNTTNGTNTITNVPITSEMYVGSSTSTITSGNTYLILTTGANFTSFGSANNNVGTVFSATSSGTAIGTAQQLNIYVGQNCFVAGYGIGTKITVAGDVASGSTYAILTVSGTNFKVAGASNNIAGTYFTATGNTYGGTGTVVKISSVTGVSGTGGTYLTIALSNNATQTLVGGTFSYSRYISVNPLGISGALVNFGQASPDNLFPNFWGDYNGPVYALGTTNTGIYTSGVDGNNKQVINFTNSGNPSYQFGKDTLSLSSSTPKIAFSSATIPTASNTSLIQLGGVNGGGIGAPIAQSASLQGNTYNTPRDLVIAYGTGTNVGVAISASNGLSGTFTLVGGTKVVSNTNITANSVVMVTLKTASGTRTGNPDIVLSVGTGFTATGGVLDTSTYNYIILSASN